jgi:hypothetical protein
MAVRARWQHMRMQWPAMLDSVLVTPGHALLLQSGNTRSSAFSRLWFLSRHSVGKATHLPV